MPQTNSCESRSIAAFVERCSHFFVVCPIVKSHDYSSVTCDYGSWLLSGENRFELFALLLSRRRRLPPIVSSLTLRNLKPTSTDRIVSDHISVPLQVVKGGDATPFMISPTAALPRSPGIGRMACCASDHLQTGTDGVQRPIPCKKTEMASVMLRMLRLLREYHLGESTTSGNDLIEFRMWTALTPTVMKGLPYDGAPSFAQSMVDFLAEYRFTKPDDEKVGSGFTPLVYAALSGSVACAKELLALDCVSVNARVQIDVPKYGIEQGMDALSMAAAACPQSHACEMVALLISYGADPNATFPSTGGTPLISAVSWHSLEGVRALLRASKLNLEKGIFANNATALLIAGFLSTFEIVEALLEAGANRYHK